MLSAVVTKRAIVGFLLLMTLLVIIVIMATSQCMYRTKRYPKKYAMPMYSISRRDEPKCVNIIFILSCFLEDAIFIF